MSEDKKIQVEEVAKDFIEKLKEVFVDVLGDVMNSLQKPEEKAPAATGTDGAAAPPASNVTKLRSL